MNRAWTRLDAIACPLPRDNVDTDALIPVSENTRVSATGFGDALFASWRYSDLDNRVPDPDFVLNAPPYRGARILVSGRDFGCGSSRESAAWAMRDYGFQAVLAVSLNDTFFRNCIRNGVLALAMPQEQIGEITAGLIADPGARILVDLDRLEVVFRKRYPIAADAYHIDLIRTGRTDDDILEQYRTEIAEKIARNMAPDGAARAH